MAAGIGDMAGQLCGSGSPLQVEEEKVTPVRCPGGSAIPEQIRRAPACSVGPRNAVGDHPRVRSILVSQVDVVIQPVGEQATCRRALDQAASDQGRGGGEGSDERDGDDRPDQAWSIRRSGGGTPPDPERHTGRVRRSIEPPGLPDQEAPELLVHPLVVTHDSRSPSCLRSRSLARRSLERTVSIGAPTRSAVSATE